MLLYSNYLDLDLESLTWKLEELMVPSYAHIAWHLHFNIFSLLLLLQILLHIHLLHHCFQIWESRTYSALSSQFTISYFMLTLYCDIVQTMACCNFKYSIETLFGVPTYTAAKP